MTKTKEIKTREELIEQMVAILSSGNASDEFFEQAANLVLKYDHSRISVTRIQGGYDHGNFEVETF